MATITIVDFGHLHDSITKDLLKKIENRFGLIRIMEKERYKYMGGIIATPYYKFMIGRDLEWDKNYKPVLEKILEEKIVKKYE